MSKLNTYEVSGHGSFPVDMLRYDGSEYADALQKDIAENGHGARTVKLILSGHRDNPCTDRWRSFLWAVSDSADLNLNEQEVNSLMDTLNNIHDKTMIRIVFCAQALKGLPRYVKANNNSIDDLHLTAELDIANTLSRRAHRLLSKLEQATQAEHYSHMNRKAVIKAVADMSERVNEWTNS